MVQSKNRTLIFKKIPQGLPVPGEHIAFQESEFDLDKIQLKDGEIAVKNLFISLDPYMRGRMRPAHIKSYSPAFGLDQPMNAGGVSQVLKSNNEKFKEGDIVTGMTNIEDYSVLPAALTQGLRKIENHYNLPLSNFIGVLGMPGLTAYSSFYEIGQPKKGETVFISAASGAVGAVVGQLAKREGLRVVGSAGTDEKVKFLKEELGFDAAFNYKKEKIQNALDKYCPDGIDINFENVGGETLEAALNKANNFARFIICGLISQYNLPPDQQFGHKTLSQVLTKRIKLQGFIVGDPGMGPKYQEEFGKNVTKWLADGSLKAKEHVVEGIENAPEALVGLFKGENFGKLVVKVADA